jgi:hypothetical protein
LRLGSLRRAFSVSRSRGPKYVGVEGLLRGELTPTYVASDDARVKGCRCLWGRGCWSCGRGASARSWANLCGCTHRKRASSDGRARSRAWALGCAVRDAHRDVREPRGADRRWSAGAWWWFLEGLVVPNTTWHAEGGNAEARKGREHRGLRLERHEGMEAGDRNTCRRHDGRGRTLERHHGKHPWGSHGARWWKHLCWRIPYWGSGTGTG